MSPSALYRQTYCASTCTSRSIMRAIELLVSTASFKASKLATTSPERVTSAVISLRRAMRCSPRRARSSSGNTSSTVMAVRKPSPPRLTGNRGISRRPMARAAESSVPSPPSTINMSQVSGTRSRMSPAIPPAYRPVSPSMRTVMPRWRSHSINLGTRAPAAGAFGLEMMPTVMPRWRSHSINLGTRAPAAGAFGLEMMPTVLMTGIEEKLLVPFGAGDGALDEGGLEPDFAHGPFDFLASRLVQPGVANDAALADLALAHFKLRFDQYNHLAAGL